MATSITVQNATATQNTNALQSFFEVAKPQISNIVFYNRKYILPMNVFKTLGLTREIKGETAQHFEAGWMMPNFHVQSTVAAVGANNPITIQVATADITNSTLIFPRITNTVLFKNGTSGYISGKSGTTVTITPLDPSYSLSVTAGDAIWIIANAQVEGSSPMESADTGRQLFQYPLQIVRENWSGTGSAITNELWFDKDQFGNMRDTYSSGYFDAEFRLWEQVGNAAIFNPYNNQPSVPQSMMYSMDYVAQTQGNTINYTGGNFGVNEIREMRRYAAKNASGTQFLFMLGPDLFDAWTTGASDTFSQNPNLFNEPGNKAFNSMFLAGYESSAQELGININFSSIKYAGYEFNAVPIHQWGLDTTGGATGFSQSGYGYAIPLTKSQDVQGTLRDRFCMTYKKNYRWNRSVQIVETGMQASVPTNGVDEVNINMLAHWGTEFYGAQNIQRVVPA